MPETIDCPFCHAGTSEPLIEDNGYTGRQCRSCGLIYVSPRPSQKEMAELYAAGDAYLPPEYFIAAADAVARRITAWHAVRTMKRHVPSGGSLLEIGPGSGGFLSQARAAGFAVHGVELNPLQAEFITGQLQIPCVSSLDAVGDLGPVEFDVVYHRDVISHFYEPIKDVRRLNELIRLGGFHVFETGNLGDVDHRHFKHIRSFQYPDHLFFYSERSIRELLRRTGLEHVHTYRYSILPEQWMRTQIRRLISRRAGAAPAAGRDVSSSPAAPAMPPSRAGRMVRDALDLTYFGIRHSLGRMRIRPSVPQTMTIVARRVS